MLRWWQKYYLFIYHISTGLLWSTDENWLTLLSVSPSSSCMSELSLIRNCNSCRMLQPPASTFASGWAGHSIGGTLTHFSSRWQRKMSFCWAFRVESVLSPAGVGGKISVLPACLMAMIQGVHLSMGQHCGWLRLFTPAVTSVSLWLTRCCHWSKGCGRGNIAWFLTAWIEWLPAGWFASSCGLHASTISLPAILVFNPEIEIWKIPFQLSSGQWA